MSSPRHSRILGWPPSRRTGLGVLCLAGVLALAGCGGESSATGTGSGPTPSPSLRSLAPLTSSAPRGPGPTDTGVPAGVVTTPSDGLTITDDNTVIDSLDITGCVVVAADDVTIRRSRITCLDAPDQRAVRMDGAHTGLVLEDVEIDGGGRTDIGVDTSRTVIRRANIHDVNDGVRMGSSVTVEDSWIHSMTRIADLHPDAIQGISAQHIIIRGNTLDPRNRVTGDPANSAIQLGSETGTKLSEDVVIEGNYLDGGNYALNISSTINAKDITVRDNRFGTSSRYGAILTRTDVPIGTGNVSEPTGVAITPDTRDG